jgi:hypothetical protein
MWWVLTLVIVLWTFGSRVGFQLPKWEFLWECEGLFPHTLLHSRASLLACNLATPYLGRKPKAKVATNLLFGLWVIDLLVNLPSFHRGAPTRPSTPEMLWAKEHTPTPSPSVVITFGLVVESIKELGGVSRGAFLKHLCIPKQRENKDI